MFKKLVIAGASAALLLTTAIPAFGSFTVNKAHVWNDVTTVSDTGLNEIHGMVVSGSPTIVTSPAKSGSLVGNLVNTNINTHGMTINKAYVGTTVGTQASTGSNEISGGFVSSGYINTGSATAGTAVVNVVNTNLSFHH